MPDSNADGTRAAPLSFDRVAVDYERTRFLPSHVAHAAADLICRDLPARSFLLDAGVGTGRYGRALAARHPRTVGVDVSRVMMDHLRKTRKSDGCNAALPCLVQADLRALPFSDGVFTSALAAHVFHLIADWRRALDEVWRVLVPGSGTLWIAREDEGDLQVRSFYLRRAAEQGVLPPNPGARTTQVLDALARRGARLEIISPPNPDALTWERSWSAQQMLDLLERRLYSLLWDVPDHVHQSLLAETRNWAQSVFGSLQARERAQTCLTLHAAHKPPDP
jgi:ubiquinone/menaquinone biosynthesis C-methylase UbiE